MEKELLKGLTEEQIAKVKECKNHEELLALAKEEGVELTDEQLKVVAGGGACSVISDIGDKVNPFDCPKCGSNNVVKDGNISTCKSCGHKWGDNYCPH
ncbi:MAG: hypothetical protein SPL00_03190 [Bacilli bacterium]|nr:hypothetical protein [Bacilli bacterium]